MGIGEVVDGKVGEAPAVVEAAPEAPEAQAQEAPAEARPDTPVPEAAAAPAEVKEKEPSVPIPTFLDMRDRATTAERRLAEIEAARPKDAPKVPDPLDDPEGYNAHISSLVTQATTAQKFEMSDVIAKQTHGEAVVDAAIDWAKDKAARDPTFVGQYMASAHPIDWIVRQHKRDGLVGGLPDDVSDLDEYVKRRAAELGLIAAPASAGVEQQQAPATPPRSLASQPSTGGVKDVPVGPMAGLEVVFPR